MSGAPETKFTPLARLLFGWTRGRGAGLSALAAIGAVGATLVFAEMIRPRLGLRLPMEAQPGFYAMLGGGAVIAAVVVAFALGWLLQRERPYKDEDGEGGDGDRA